MRLGARGKSHDSYPLMESKAERRKRKYQFRAEAPKGISDDEETSGGR